MQFKTITTIISSLILVSALPISLETIDSTSITELPVNEASNAAVNTGDLYSPVESFEEQLSKLSEEQKKIAIEKYYGIVNTDKKPKIVEEKDRSEPIDGTDYSKVVVDEDAIKNGFSGAKQVTKDSNNYNVIGMDKIIDANIINNNKNKNKNYFGRISANPKGVEFNVPVTSNENENFNSFNIKNSNNNNSKKYFGRISANPKGEKFNIPVTSNKNKNFNSFNINNNNKQFK